MNGHEQFVIELLKLLIPLVIGIHLKQPGYMRKGADLAVLPGPEDKPK